MDLEPQGSPERTSTKRPVRSIVTVVLLAAIIMVVGAVVVNRDDSDAIPAAEPAVTKEVAVERGDISVRETVDGTVEETDTITVVHRIEGQTPTTPTTPTTTATPSSQAVAAPAASASPGASAAPAELVSPDVTQSSTAPVETPSELAIDTDAESAIVTSVFMAAVVPPVDTTVPTTTPTDTGAPTDTTPTTAPTETTPTPDVSVPATTETATNTVPTRPGGAAIGGGSLAVVPGSGTSTGASGASTDTVSEMITGVAAIGVPISSGDVLYTVESRPVVALEGELPAWRTMNRSSDDGADIEQLEAALVALGYDPDGDVTVDASWDSDTTAMVKRWQVGLGADDTGVVTLGSVVFIPQAATVTSASARVGDEVSDGDTVLELSGTAQQVIIDVPIELRANVIPSIRVDLAGTPGTVTRLRSADGTDGVTVQAVISPDAKLDVDAGSTIKVTISYDLATGQLVVPTDAVVSRLDGTYAVQILDDTGDRTFVTVAIVAVSGNRTAITGDGLRESTVVFVPA